MRMRPVRSPKQEGQEGTEREPGHRLTYQTICTCTMYVLDNNPNCRDHWDQSNGFVQLCMYGRYGTVW